MTILYVALSHQKVRYAAVDINIVFCTCVFTCSQRGCLLLDGMVVTCLVMNDMIQSSFDQSVYLTLTPPTVNTLVNFSV